MMKKAREMSRKRLTESDQLCWNCANACGGCDWSRFFKPVKGWVAESTVIDNNDRKTSSYEIQRCPEFIRG